MSNPFNLLSYAKEDDASIDESIFKKLVARKR